MGETSYGKFIRAVDDFSKISNNVIAICQERTRSYSRSGSSSGGALGGAIGGFLGDGKGSRGESIGSFFGSAIGGAIGEAIADSRNSRDIEEAKAHIKTMLTEWKTAGLPIIKSYLETYQRTTSLHGMETDYLAGYSKLKSSNLTEEGVKSCTYLLRQCIASQFREYYDVELGNNIIRYINNYSRHLSDLENFRTWQIKCLYVDRTELYKTAYDVVVGKVRAELKGSSEKNFETVLLYYASEVPAFLGTDYDTGIFKDAKNNALLLAEAAISGKKNDYSPDCPSDGYGFDNILHAAVSSYTRFEFDVIKPKIRKMEIRAGIGLPVFMLLNLIIKIYRWFNISSAFFRFFLCHYWGNVLAYIILSQVVILIAVLIKKKKLASKPLDWKGFLDNFESSFGDIRENAYDTELSLPPLKIRTRKPSAKTAGNSQTGEDVLSDDELLKLAGS